MNTDFDKFVQDFGKQPDSDRDEASKSNKRQKKKEIETSDQKVELDIEALRRRVHVMIVQPHVDNASEDELERLIREAFEKPSDEEVELSEKELTEVEIEPVDQEMQESDTEMEDAETEAKSEQEQIDDAWTAYNKAIAEDQSLAPKPQPIKFQGLQAPISRQRKRDVADDLTHLTTTGAVHVLTLKASFDMSDKPQYVQSQKPHFEIHGHHATTIQEFFETLWYENEGWLVFHGYPLQRVQRVRRLEVTLILKEGKDVKETPCWSIKGDFKAREQCETWKEFLDTANSWGRKEAAEQEKVIEWYSRAKRKRCMKDDFGNLYDHTGNYYKEAKHSVHAYVDAEIVLHFD